MRIILVHDLDAEGRTAESFDLRTALIDHLMYFEATFLEVVLHVHHRDLVFGTENDLGVVTTTVPLLDHLLVRDTERLYSRVSDLGCELAGRHLKSPVRDDVHDGLHGLEDAEVHEDEHDDGDDSAPEEHVQNQHDTESLKEALLGACEVAVELSKEVVVVDVEPRTTTHEISLPRTAR